MPTDPLEIVKLGKALGDFDEEEVDFIIRYAKEKTPEAIIDASKDDWVQTAIKARREKVAEQNKVPGPSSAGSFGGAKKPIEQMTAKEFEQYESEFQRKQRPSGI